MAWAYSDWRAYSGADQVSRLALHLQEIEDALSTPDYTIEGRSVNRRNLLELYRDLKKEYAALGGGAPSATGASCVILAGDNTQGIQ